MYAMVACECGPVFLFLNFAGVGGYTYLREPLWWAGMVTSKCANLISSLSLSLSFSKVIDLNFEMKLGGLDSFM